MRTYYAVRFALKVSKAHNIAYHSPTKIGHAYSKPNLKTLCRYTPCRLTAVYECGSHCRRHLPTFAPRAIS